MSIGPLKVNGAWLVRWIRTWTWPLPTIASPQMRFAAAIVVGWILRTRQVGRPAAEILPRRLIPIEIVFSCGGGSAPSADLKLLSIVTATGATPVRGSARGEIPPL